MCARRGGGRAAAGPGGAPPRRVAILSSLLGGWHDNRYPMASVRCVSLCVFATGRQGGAWSAVRAVGCDQDHFTLSFGYAGSAPRLVHFHLLPSVCAPASRAVAVAVYSRVYSLRGVPVRSMSLVHHYTQPSQAAHTQNTQPHFTQTTHTSHVLLYMLTPQCEGGALCLHSILIHSCFISHSFGFIILIRWTTAPRPIRDVLLAAFLEEPISLQLFERIRRDCSCV